ncbi:hypothetical protein CU098_006827 [Rhizopus stolonifer]|uniref:Uncharacterized protein n=1 Tax=Rhizopus stolonifer TaxID=4846 RepID=A0A367IR58_RHIST|nr:hypothetical protein CU098_006827 [Rhizopus stolonifer]
MLTPGLWQKPILDFIEGEYENDVADRVCFVQEELVKIREIAREASDDAKLKRAIRYNKMVHQAKREYHLGEQVLLKENVLENKFADKWSGPYVVQQILRNGTYILEGPRKRSIKAAVNGDSLKPFVESRFMIPDVATVKAKEYFRTWTNAKRNISSTPARRV